MGQMGFTHKSAAKSINHRQSHNFTLRSIVKVKSQSVRALLQPSILPLHRLHTCGWDTAHAPCPLVCRIVTGAFGRSWYYRKEKCLGLRAKLGQKKVVLPPWGPMGCLLCLHHPLSTPPTHTQLLWSVYSPLFFLCYKSFLGALYRAWNFSFIFVFPGPWSKLQSKH